MHQLWSCCLGSGSGSGIRMLIPVPDPDLKIQSGPRQKNIRSETLKTFNRRLYKPIENLTSRTLRRLLLPNGPTDQKTDKRLHRDATLPSKYPLTSRGSLVPSQMDSTIQTNSLPAGITGIPGVLDHRYSGSGSQVYWVWITGILGLHQRYTGSGSQIYWVWIRGIPVRPDYSYTGAQAYWHWITGFTDFRL